MDAAAWFEELKSAEGLKNQWVQHGPRLASGLLLAVIAIQAAVLLTSQPGSPSAGAVDEDSMALPVPTAAPNRVLELATILNAHLFGQAGATAVDGADAPQTSLPLVLAGILAVQDPQQGMAILGPNAASAKLYSTGSNIPGGARLHSVYSDRVLLDRNGSVEALFLPKTLSTTPVVVQPAAQAGTNPGQRLQNLAQNNALLGGVVRVQPVLQQGKLSGYRIFPGSRSNIQTFTQLGLRSGDLITAVNGTVLDDPNRGMEIMQTLSSASSATITVTRNGQPMEVNLNLETVAQEAEAAAAAETDTEAAAGGARRGAGPPAGAFGGRSRRGSVGAPPPPAAEAAGDESETGRVPAER
jgi:general secretion pathway protein C